LQDSLRKSVVLRKESCKNSCVGISREKLFVPFSPINFCFLILTRYNKTIKRQKTGKAIQERINLAMRELKDLQDMNDPENDEDITIDFSVKKWFRTYVVTLECRHLVVY